MAFPTIALDWAVAAELITLQEVTGTYDAATNPGGYAAPGVGDYDDYAHYAIIRKMGVNGTDDAVLTIETYNPLTATEFIAPRAVDGWYEAAKFTIPIWVAGTYAADTVIYYSGSIYLSNTSTSQTPGAGSQWDVVTDLEDIEDNTSIDVTYKGISTPYNGDVYWSKQIAANSQLGRCGICDDDRQKKRLDEIKLHIYATNAADRFENYSDGEWNALALQTMGAK